MAKKVVTGINGYAAGVDGLDEAGRSIALPFHPVLEYEDDKAESDEDAEVSLTLHDQCKNFQGWKTSYRTEDPAAADNWEQVVQGLARKRKVLAAAMQDQS